MARERRWSRALCVDAKKQPPHLSPETSRPTSGASLPFCRASYGREAAGVPGADGERGREPVCHGVAGGPENGDRRRRERPSVGLRPSSGQPRRHLIQIDAPNHPVCRRAPIIRSTLILCGWISDEYRKRHVVPEPWAGLKSTAEQHKLHKALAPFFRYCDRLGLTPDAITSSTLQAYVEWLTICTLDLYPGLTAQWVPSATAGRSRFRWPRSRRCALCSRKF